MAKTLVFVHGIDGTGELAKSTLTAMFGMKRYRLVSYDLLGRGEQLGNKVSSHSLNAYVSQLKSVTRDIKDPFFLVGFSLGGAIANAFTAKYPKRILKVALICPVVNSSVSYAVNMASNIPYTMWKHIVPKIMMSNMDASFEGVSRYKQYIAAKHALYEDERFIRVLYDTFRQFPFTKLDAKPLRRPALVVAAISDKAIPEAAVREFAESIGANIAVYEGDHSLLTRKPGIIGAAIHRFFSES